MSRQRESISSVLIVPKERLMLLRRVKWASARMMA
jgi:hypothetical protein